MDANSQMSQPMPVYPPALHRAFSGPAADKNPKAKPGKVLIEVVIIPHQLDKPLVEGVISLDANRIPMGKTTSDSVERVLQAIATKPLEWSQVEDIQGVHWALQRRSGKKDAPPCVPAWPSGPDGPELVKPIIQEGEPLCSIWTGNSSEIPVDCKNMNVEMWPPRLNQDSLALTEGAVQIAYNLNQATGSPGFHSAPRSTQGSFIFLYNKPPMSGPNGDAAPLVPPMKLMNLRAMSLLRGISDHGNCNTAPYGGGAPPKIGHISGNVLVLKKKTFDEAKKHLILHNDLTIAELVMACNQYPIVSHDDAASWMASNTQWNNFGGPNSFLSRNLLSDAIDITAPPPFAPAVTVDDDPLSSAPHQLYQNMFGHGFNSARGDSSMWLGTTEEGDQHKLTGDDPLEPEVCAVVMQQFAEQLTRAIPVFQKAAKGLVMASLAPKNENGDANHEVQFMRTVLEDTLALNAKLSHEIQRSRHLVSKLFEENSRLRVQILNFLTNHVSGQQSSVAPGMPEHPDLPSTRFDTRFMPSQQPMMFQGVPFPTPQQGVPKQPNAPQLTAQLIQAHQQQHNGTMNMGMMNGAKRQSSTTGTATPHQVARCTTAFDSSSMKEPDQFANLKKDDLVRVLFEDKSGWWKVASHEKSTNGLYDILGWFPSSYLEKATSQN